jgi:hypothetical protein
MTKHPVGYLCGNVRFELSADSEIAYGCHCRFCQKSTGTAIRSGMRCKKKLLRLTMRRYKLTFTPAQKAEGQ